MSQTKHIHGIISNLNRRIVPDKLIISGREAVSYYFDIQVVESDRYVVYLCGDTYSIENVFQMIETPYSINKVESSVMFQGQILFTLKTEERITPELLRKWYPEPLVPFLETIRFGINKDDINTKMIDQLNSLQLCNPSNHIEISPFLYMVSLGSLIWDMIRYFIVYGDTYVFTVLEHPHFRDQWIKKVKQKCFELPISDPTKRIYTKTESTIVTNINVLTFRSLQTLYKTMVSILMREENIDIKDFLPLLKLKEKKDIKYDIDSLTATRDELIEWLRHNDTDFDSNTEEVDTFLLRDKTDEILEQKYHSSNRPLLIEAIQQLLHTYPKLNTVLVTHRTDYIPSYDEYDWDIDSDKNIFHDIIKNINKKCEPYNIKIVIKGGMAFQFYCKLDIANKDYDLVVLSNATNEKSQYKIMNKIAKLIQYELNSRNYNPDPEYKYEDEDEDEYVITSNHPALVSIETNHHDPFTTRSTVDITHDRHYPAITNRYDKEPYERHIVEIEPYLYTLSYAYLLRDTVRMIHQQLEPGYKNVKINRYVSKLVMMLLALTDPTLFNCHSPLLTQRYIEHTIRKYRPTLSPHVKYEKMKQSKRVKYYDRKSMKPVTYYKRKH